MNCTIQNIRLGALVRDGYGRISLVTEINYGGCQQSEEWIREQSRPITRLERKDHWLHLAPLDGGATVTPMSRCELLLSQEDVADVLRTHLVEAAKDGGGT